MTKPELIRAIAKKTGQKMVDVEKTLDALTTLIMDTVSTGSGAVKLIGFGKFSRVMRPGRFMRNPQTGAMFKTQDRWRPKFKPSTAFIGATENRRATFVK